MENTLTGLFEQTLKNCKYYEKEREAISLANEIGVLRGIAYCMELAGEEPSSEEFMYYIDVQQKLKSLDKPHN